jgi:hypothetical protein
MAVTKDSGPKWDNPVTVTAGVLLVIHMLLRYTPGARSQWPDPGGLDTVALALIVVGLLPWIADFLTEAKLPGGIEVAFRAVQRRQEMNEQAIAQLRFIVDGFVTPGEYQHLLNIRSNIEYLVQEQDVAPLQTELRRLRALGLIEQVRPNYGVARFATVDNVRRRIADWFRITPRGEEYLSMRKENKATEGTPAVRNAATT